jgi:hypothetical protein
MAAAGLGNVLGLTNGGLLGMSGLNGGLGMSGLNGGLGINGGLLGCAACMTNGWTTAARRLDASCMTGRLDSMADCADCMTGLLGAACMAGPLDSNCASCMTGAWLNPNLLFTILM